MLMQSKFEVKDLF